MSKYLVIVESPTKARTISSILGSDYEVTSSMGHVVDLPSKRLAVDIEGDFTPQFKVIPGKEKLLGQLKKLAQSKEAIYLATDPDREGEAISWHIKENLFKEAKPKKTKTKKKKEQKQPDFYRVTFHEITEDALNEAFRHPQKLDDDKINAQIARRVLDRIVGYYLSPLLWKKIVRGLSAGRVQSIALKFIAEREKEIKAFVPQTTYTITAKFKTPEGKEFEARLEKFKGKKAVFNTKEEAKAAIDQLKKEKFSLNSITKKETKRKPLPPHTTSLLQQEAFSKLRFSSQKTMLVAQKLYEGIQIKDKTVGLITYMRTDSFHIAPKAKVEAKDFIKNAFGDNYLPEKDHKYKEKKGAQRAHEAIRPTSIHRGPADMQESLGSDEAKLYDLIWKRFLASLMSEAVYENTKYICKSSSAEFVAEGRRTVFEGFLKIFGKQDDDKLLPELDKGAELSISGSKPVDHTTKPPPRFNDASLVKVLEEKGIGRPSTYAPTIATILRRNYLKREKGYFMPTDLGMQVSDMLLDNFPSIMNENFTAHMEDNLDKVEEGKVKWQEILKEFFPDFKEQIDKATTVIKKHVEFSEKICPKCNGKMVIKWSRKGRFLSCENFPKCKYAESITTDVVCPDCKEGKLIERRNKRGQFFYGCSNFPQCRFTSRSLPKQEDESGKTDESQTKEE